MKYQVLPVRYIPYHTGTDRDSISIITWSLSILSLKVLESLEIHDKSYSGETAANWNGSEAISPASAST